MQTTCFIRCQTGIKTLNAELVSTLNVAETAETVLRAFPQPVVDGPVCLTGWQGGAEVVIWSADGRFVDCFVTVDAAVNVGA